jgi:hypothetical protein
VWLTVWPTLCYVCAAEGFEKLVPALSPAGEGVFLCYKTSESAHEENKKWSGANLKVGSPDDVLNQAYRSLQRRPICLLEP